MHRFLRWRAIIQSAGDIAAVRRAMRDYADGIPPAVRSALPPDCQRALEDDDVQAAAITILHCELAYRDGDQATTELLHEIAHTYAAASLRIARLGAEPLTSADS